MGNIFLNQLLSAADKMPRPRFACSLILAMAAQADENGVVNATRNELAEIVDRGEHQSRRADRLSRISRRTVKYIASMKELKRQLDNGEISKGLYDQETIDLSDRHRKFVRSPTLANVSNVISHFRKSGLMSVTYVDPDTGKEFSTTARGRYAKYRFRIPPGQQLMQGQEQVRDATGVSRQEKEYRSKPVNRASGHHQLNLF